MCVCCLVFVTEKTNIDDVEGHCKDMHKLANNLLQFRACSSTFVALLLCSCSSLKRNLFSCKNSALYSYFADQIDLQCLICLFSVFLERTLW